MKKNKDANYNKAKQREPESPMGSGSFANLPSKAAILAFSTDHGYRDGILNNPACGVEDLSKIHENYR
jgi:hypothetical protein